MIVRGQFSMRSNLLNCVGIDLRLGVGDLGEEPRD
jgi:hypothetical protein